MSAAAVPVPANGSWHLWRIQMASIVWMELKKNFITKRGFWVYLLAAAPAVVAWMHSIVALQRPDTIHHDLSRDTQIFAIMFNVFLLRPAIYFGCVGIFTYLFRGELVERSLHYYFLAPVRREVLVLAKYAAGAVTAVTFFGLSTLVTFWGMYGHFPSYETSEFMNAAGRSHLFGYMSVTVLACLAWGAVCLWMGIRWRNPIVPSVSFLLWESINVFLPSWLRPLSVLHYLQSMTPVHAEDLRGPGLLLGQTVDPVPAWLAVICLAAITAGMLYLSVYQLKKTEISYSSD